MAWAVTSCFKCTGILSAGNIYCFACNRSFIKNTLIRGNICPCCGATLNIESSRKKLFDDASYFSVIELVNEYQIIRHFCIRRLINIKNYTNVVEVTEIVQNFHDAHVGLNYTIARVLQMGYYYKKIPFALSSKMELRHTDRNIHYISGYVYPIAKIHRYYKQRGLGSNLHNIQPDMLFLELRYNPQAETLLKAGMFEMLDSYIARMHVIAKNWSQIKIALRHKYIIKDSSMWIDHIDLLSRCGKDIRSPRYILPNDLNKEHQILIDLLNKRREKEEEKQRKQQAIKDALEAESENKKYIEEKGRYFDWSIMQGDISVSVVKSLHEMVEEGNEMHHCVFGCKYYEKNCLILSVRRSGERLATVELDLEDYKIKQLRGVCNSHIEEGNEIRQIITSNIHSLIKIKAS